MSFHLYQGNRLEELVDRLGNLIVGTADPFAEETIVVPETGLGNWLARELAQAHGLCPAIEWIRPGDFLYKYIFNPMRGLAEAHDISSFTPEITAWKIFSELKEATHPRLVGYFKGDDLKRWQLAQRVANLFDRYMTYRQDLLEGWRKNQTLTASPDEPWQRELWLKLIHGRSDVFSQLATAYLSNPGDSLTPQKRRFFFFGITSLPAIHLQCAFKLAAQAEIHFFMLNPCETLWDDVKSRKAELHEAQAIAALTAGSLADFYHYACNPLLGSLGRKGRDFFSEMIDDGLNHEEATAFYSFTATAPSLLAALRQDIQQNVRRAKPDFTGATRSLSVHICYSPQRELEVLRDQLLLAFQELPGLTPNDIRVYTPDPAAYEPFIESVFGSSEAPALPYCLVGRSLAGDYPECAVFIQILDLFNSRFGASAILDILASEPVSRRFRLSPLDVEKLAALIVNAHAAWGLDAAYKASLGGAATDRHSWAFALDRLTLGAAMADPDPTRPPFAANGRACFPEASAEGSSVLVGILAEVLGALAEDQAFIDDRRPHTVTEWSERFLRPLFRVFFSDEGTPGFLALNQLVSSLEEILQASGVGSEPFTFPVLKSWLLANMQSPNSGHFATGGITFSAFPASGLALPARVVAVIGMNDNAFPRPVTPLGFDLMTETRRLGDPSPRDDDRYAFLQTLLSASERFLVTYTGRSERDNSVLPPSILVGELLDAVDLYLPNGRAEVTIEHPLLPFSPAYFEEGHDPRLLSFSRTQANLSRQTRQPPTPRQEQVTLPASDVVTLDLESLIAFLASPLTYFVKNVLGASLEIDSDAEPQDLEPLEPPNPLEEYSLNDALFQIRLENDSAAVRQALLNRVAAGELALLSPRQVENHLNIIDGLYNQLLKLGVGTHPEAAATAEIALGRDQLTATFRSLFAQATQVIIHPSSQTNGKLALRLLTYHLARLAAGAPLQKTLGLTRNEALALVLTGQDTAQARTALSRMLDLYKRGVTHPLCFDVSLFWNAYTARGGYSSEAAQQAWAGSFHVAGAAPFLRTYFGDSLENENLSEFDSISRLLAALLDSFKGDPA